MKPRVDEEEEEEEEVPINRWGPYGTKKCGFSLKLKGEQMATYNHAISVYNHGHTQAAKLTEEQLIQTEQFRKSHVPLRNILRFFREQDVGCAVSAQKIYNVVAKIYMSNFTEKYFSDLNLVKNVMISTRIQTSTGK
ncbi:hypothetical protein M9H77_19724 [Catharanthus roseus]|uniref:Uncharacterized protein n=1 Tax=Catharanthus roseus TaxID=4058 RepID=A0ACC0BB44_CATRO|nr:hypothetical protein M9H77_19724 [Catharanthus roseus]